MTENDIVTSIIQYLQYTGWLVLRVNSGAIKANYTDKRGETRQRFYWLVKWFVLGREAQTAGVSDILAFRGGIRLAIECKTPGNNPTEAQKEFLAAWAEHGGVWCVARSVEDVQIAIEAIEYQEGI